MQHAQVQVLDSKTQDQKAIIVLIITLCVSVLLGAGCCILALGIQATKTEGAAHASAGLGFQDPGPEYHDCAHYLIVRVIGRWLFSGSWNPSGENRFLVTEV